MDLVPLEELRRGVPVLRALDLLDAGRPGRDVSDLGIEGDAIEVAPTHVGLRDDARGFIVEDDHEAGYVPVHEEIEGFADGGGRLAFEHLGIGDHESGYKHCACVFN
eukprot:CAMPEP_0201680434 /NCGR_PEP_ID=MMETSP0494-20130426/50600_1 /ASSEMBLY_ACC=CAM_ASM_000839 /TAXON_ID=420259 /ORGANISM="Thalassiosira gravida, Strain GMp14c1" /LENGTH=106 /DNA_ID=CAMNT_0048164157 /DNA_START=2137 /DNA_END=2457 /DNA_ORIENTATION=-